MSRIFEHFPREGNPCPLCNTNDDGPCFLAPIDGSANGRNCEAVCVHVECIARLARFQRPDMLYALGEEPKP